MSSLVSKIETALGELELVLAEVSGNGSSKSLVAAERAVKSAAIQLRWALEQLRAEVKR